MNQMLFDENISPVSEQKCATYNTLAQIYDHMMQHVDYRRWANYIIRIIENYSSLPSRLLDVGCGTGRFIKNFSEFEATIDGCDSSAEMLKIASHRNPNSEFILDSMPLLKKIPDKKYTVITCLYDTINYLQDETALTQFLNRVYDLLPVEGLLIFDAVSEVFCQHYFNSFNENEVVDKNYAYSRTSHYRPAKRQQINEIRIHTPAGTFEEKHTQKIFPFKKIKKIVRKKTDFKFMAMYEDFSFFDAQEDSDRAHFILKRIKNS